MANGSRGQNAESQEPGGIKRAPGSTGGPEQQGASQPAKEKSRGGTRAAEAALSPVHYTVWSVVPASSPYRSQPYRTSYRLVIKGANRRRQVTRQKGRETALFVGRRKEKWGTIVESRELLLAIMACVFCSWRNLA